jgi:hypothetical protein
MWAWANGETFCTEGTAEWKALAARRLPSIRSTPRQAVVLRFPLEDKKDIPTFDFFLNVLAPRDAGVT